MLPQIVHHVPPVIQSFDQAGSEDLYQTHSNISFPAKHGPSTFRQSVSRSVPGPFGSSQYAYPVRLGQSPQPLRELDAGPSSSSASQNPNFAEHMLRRKTPNGTLAAGYDGTPVQWSTKPPAPKYVVLPISSTPRVEVPNPKNKYFKSTHHTSGSIPESSKYSWYQQSSSAQISQPGATQVGQDNIFDVMEDFSRFNSLTDASNTVFQHSTVPQGTLHHMYDAMHIPTVLQPVYQPAVGPTASNDAGFYGPYWPDGTFEPYRPAAVRIVDYRNASSNLGHNSTVSAQQHPRPLSYDANSYMSDVGRLSSQPFTSNSSNSVTSDIFRQRYNMCLQPSMNQVINAGFSQMSIKGQNIQFKEKVLVWAHSIYIDLLTFLHHSKKKHNHSKHSHSQQKSYTQTNIYPRPPRHPSLDLGAHSTHLSPSGVKSQIPSQNLGLRPNAAVKPPDASRQSNGFGNDSWRLDIQFLGQQPNINRASSRRRADHDVAPVYGQVSQHPSVLDTATAALEILSSLCQESDWRWIDGMLVGGCLAYGLEDYGTALDWFRKIVSIDSSHVEAMSNLAATLLSLNRREEAEQYWLQSVKLRPTYFEAVEHLIGLLCADHRGNEAIAIIEYVERSLRMTDSGAEPTARFAVDEDHSSLSLENPTVDLDGEVQVQHGDVLQHGFGTSGFAVPGSDNGRILALVHAKGNMLYAQGDVLAAARAFEDAVLISTGRKIPNVQSLIRKILHVLSVDNGGSGRDYSAGLSTNGGSISTPLLLPPDKALRTASLVFSKDGQLPGLHHVPEGAARNAAISTTSNSLLSLAKIFQDGMATSSQAVKTPQRPSGVDDILALYYLSLSLQPSPSTANNVGILLASVQQPVSPRIPHLKERSVLPAIPGVVPGSGIALALAYYNYGLNLDSRHAHLYTNLGSLLKDIGQLAAAIKMYEQAVACDSTFDIALANLANAVKDQGRISDAIEYYKRAVASSPDFAEAVCGLANALNSVCDWTGRGGVILEAGKYDRWHVDDDGMLCDAVASGVGFGWMKRVVGIVSKQLEDGANWGRGLLTEETFAVLVRQLEMADTGNQWSEEKSRNMQSRLGSWIGKSWEGARVVRLVERATKRAMHRWFKDKFVEKKTLPHSSYARPQLPGILPVPGAPTVLPFHTFTCPLSAKDIRMISQRNALRISCSTLRAPWLPTTVYPPPSPPNPVLNIGYVSSDFNNHPLAHLMQSVFGLHNQAKVKAFCYATTASDHSSHRQQIEREAPVFRDASCWSSDKLVQQIVQDEIHILVNLNGYTRGARNEIFAARPSPIQMSFMGFAGTLGAEWCDYLLADETAIPPETLRPWRRNVEVEDQLCDDQSIDEEEWIYSENIIFCRDTFFCCDHRQSSQDVQLPWDQEQQRRWKMRKEIFPNLSDDAIILGNFNQLYKIEPTTFRTWLRILSKVPKAILWLLRFPDLGESNLKRTARLWAGEEVASRIWFTDVAPKNQHISRARVCDLFLDTPECNAHTTAADILWSATPLLTLPRYKYKMCSRMAASILKGALPKNESGQDAALELIAQDDDQYEKFAVKLASGLVYNRYGVGTGRLIELRKLLYEHRWTCALFDTKRWVSELETAYEEAWRRWVNGIGGDIYL